MSVRFRCLRFCTGVKTHGRPALAQREQVSRLLLLVSGRQRTFWERQCTQARWDESSSEAVETIAGSMSMGMVGTCCFCECLHRPIESERSQQEMMRLKEGWEGGEKKSGTCPSPVSCSIHMCTQRYRSHHDWIYVSLYPAVCTRYTCTDGPARHFAPVPVICRASSHFQCVA